MRVEGNFERDAFVRSEIEGAENARRSALSDEGIEAKAPVQDLPDLHATCSIVANEKKV